MGNPNALTEVAAFQDICGQIREIDRRNAREYPQVKLIGRDCYLWKDYVIKSSPGIWNFKTHHESEMLKYLNSQVGTQCFPELLADFTVDNRNFLLLRYIPHTNLYNLYYKHKWQALKILPGIIDSLEQEAEIIRGKLRGLKIMHRDIRPDNLLFDSRQKRLVLLDFGLAIREGEEIQTDSQEAKDLLDNAVKQNLGGEYRQPSADFSYESDGYSFEKIILEMKRMSPWTRFRA